MTREEKIKVLLKMKDNLLDLESRDYLSHIGRHSFICNSFSIVTSKSASQAFKNIPELLKYKPKNLFFGDVWFNADEEGTRKRVEIIEKTIQDIKAMHTNLS